MLCKMIKGDTMSNKELVRAIGIAGALALGATSAMAAHDNFNRSKLGKKWVVTVGSLYITSDQMQGTTSSLGYFKPSANDSEASALVTLGGTDLEYGAVAVGDVASGTNAFVKIQEENADNMFEYGAFYTGNNSGSQFFALSSPVPSPATLTVSICGTTATMKIKSSAGTQKYSYDYGTSVGTGGGLGTYGNIFLDNYKSKAAKCGFDPEATVVKRTNVRDLSQAK